MSEIENTGDSKNMARNQSSMWCGPEPTPWKNDAACIGQDPDVFFPNRGASHKAAKRVCAGCPVRAECLEYAMQEHITHGVWGGLSEKQRRDLRRSFNRQRQCAQCGVRFAPSPHQKFCSEACRLVRVRLTKAESDRRRAS